MSSDNNINSRSIYCARNPSVMTLTGDYHLLVSLVVERIWDAISGGSDLNLDAYTDSTIAVKPLLPDVRQDIDVSEFLPVLAFNYWVFSPFIKNISWLRQPYSYRVEASRQGDRTTPRWWLHVTAAPSRYGLCHF